MDIFVRFMAKIESFLRVYVLSRFNCDELPQVIALSFIFMFCLCFLIAADRFYDGRLVVTTETVCKSS